MTTEVTRNETTQAESPQKVEAVGPFTAEQFAAARQTYEGLQALFAPKVTVNNVGSHSPNYEAVGNHKTMGDATDKALDMLHEGSSKMLDLLGQGAAQIAATTEKAAPVIWKIMVKQQIANALANIIGPIIMLLSAWIFHLIISASFGVVSDPNVKPWAVGLGFVAPIGLSIIAVIWFINALIECLQQLINPQYFAARDLISIITRRQKY